MRKRLNGFWSGALVVLIGFVKTMILTYFVNRWFLLLFTLDFVSAWVVGKLAAYYDYLSEKIDD